MTSKNFKRIKSAEAADAAFFTDLRKQALDVFARIEAKQDADFKRALDLQAKQRADVEQLANHGAE